MIPRKVLKYVFGVEPGVLVAAPGIDGVALRRKLQTLYGLRKSGVGVARLSTKLHEDRGTKNLHRPEREWNMPDPRCRRDQPIRIFEYDRPENYTRCV